MRKMLLAAGNLKSLESFMNQISLPLVNPRHQIGRFKGFRLFTV